MNRRANSGWAVSRRGFAAALGGGVAAAAVPLRAALPAIAGGPVVGFHADAPWVDPTGRDLPYMPPAAPGRFVADDEALARIGVFL